MIFLLQKMLCRISRKKYEVNRFYSTYNDLYNYFKYLLAKSKTLTDL